MVSAAGEVVGLGSLHSSGVKNAISSGQITGLGIVQTASVAARTTSGQITGLGVVKDEAGPTFPSGGGGGFRAVKVMTLTAANIPFESSTSGFHGPYFDLKTLAAGTILYDIVVSKRVQFDADIALSFGFKLNQGSPPSIYLLNGQSINITGDSENPWVSGSQSFGIEKESLVRNGLFGGGKTLLPGVVIEEGAILMALASVDGVPTVGECDIWVLMEEPFAGGGPLFDSIDDTIDLMPFFSGGVLDLSTDMSAFTVDPTDPLLEDPEVDGSQGNRTGWGKLDLSSVGDLAVTVSVQPAFRAYVYADTESGLVRIAQTDASGSVTTVLPGGVVYYIEVVPLDAEGSGDMGGQIGPGIEPHDHASVIEIIVDGTDITEFCGLANTNFRSLANGGVGNCEIWVKDLDQELFFTTGKIIQLKIDGQNAWTGYVTNVTRKYIFSVMNTDEPTTVPRWLVVRGADINILFSRRFVYNKAAPEKAPEPYPQHTYDYVAIADLCANFLDLEGDDINVSGGVLPVGDIAPDGKSYPFEPGMEWGTAMRFIAQIPAALFYIDPDRILRYVDVDRPTAPFKLSDVPDREDSFGYREITLIDDGTALANDAMVWGAGLGSSNMHFGRYEDTDSIAEHGRWQWADYREDLWHNATLLKRARTYVLGADDSSFYGDRHRGHNEPAISRELTIFRPGLRVGMVVEIENAVFATTERLPIREMAFSFVATKHDPHTGENRHYVKYWVKAAEVLDDPWNNAEYPVPLNYKKQNHCQEVIRLDLCLPTTTVSGDEIPQLVASFYDDFNFDEDRGDEDAGWSTVGGIHDTDTPPWGDGGCGAWEYVHLRNITDASGHTIKAGEGWTPKIGLPPYCVLVAMPRTGIVSIANGFCNGVWYAAGGISKPIEGDTDGEHGYVMRVRTNTDWTIQAKAWWSDAPEPAGWGIVSTPTFNPETTLEYALLPSLTNGPRGSGDPQDQAQVRFTASQKPDGVAISVGSWEGWIWYQNAESRYHSSHYVNYGPDSWSTQFNPAGTRPPDGGTSGIHNNMDALCGNYQCPPMPRDDSENTPVNEVPGVNGGALLHKLVWSWMFQRELSPPEDGRMIADVHRYAAFRPPYGAQSCRLQARVRVSTPETGLFSIGSQPHPTGEGAIGWEVWKVNGYDGTGSPNYPSHTVLAEGSQEDYVYDPDYPGTGQWGGNYPLYQDIDVTFDCDPETPIQLGGRITNTYEDLIASHLQDNPGTSSATNLHQRVLQLVMSEVKLSFSWIPVHPCGDLGFLEIAGYTKSVNCDDGSQFCEPPKYKEDNTYETLYDYVNDSLVVYYDGVRKVLTTATTSGDYTQTDPTHGLFTYDAMDGDQSDHLSACYHVHAREIFPLPKADPKYNKHPGYTINGTQVSHPTTGNPIYHPHFLSQFGWGTVFDSVNCTCTSAAVWLDAVTGGVTTTTPPGIRAAQADQSGGISLDDAAEALATFGVTLNVHHNASFASFRTALIYGPVMMAGLYGEIPRSLNSQLDFTGGHSMMALTFSASKTAVLIYDPLNYRQIWMPTAVVRNYMEAFNDGSGCDYGALI